MCYKCDTDDTGYPYADKNEVNEFIRKLLIGSDLFGDPYAADNQLLKDWRKSVIETHQITDNITLKLLSYVSPEDINTIITTVRNLNKVAPAPGKVEILAPASRNPDEEGLTTRVNENGIVSRSLNTDKGRVVVLAPAVFGDQIEYQARIGNNPTAYMPSAQHTTNLVYTIVHEWGHVIDARSRIVDTMYTVVKKLNYTNSLDTFLHSMSLYGTSAEPEAYAESFSEWFLTDGKTNNFAAKWYAKEFGWTMPTTK